MESLLSQAKLLRGLGLEKVKADEPQYQPPWWGRLFALKKNVFKRHVKGYQPATNDLHRESFTSCLSRVLVT